MENIRSEDRFGGECFPLSVPDPRRIIEKVDKLFLLCDELEQQLGNQSKHRERLMNSII
jgi:hypothetical protein